MIISNTISLKTLRINETTHDVAFIVGILSAHELRMRIDKNKTFMSSTTITQ